jgi:hypothetical protein
MNRRRRGLSLLELSLVLTLGAFLTVITGMCLRNAARVFTLTSSRDSALRNLARARNGLERDLVLVSLDPANFSIVQSPASLGGGADGDAIVYLSAVNATANNHMVALTDGSSAPYFYQNILYYITTPTNHDALFTGSCSGGNENGYDYNCPHKSLVRVVADQNPAFDPSNPATQDTLLTNLSGLMVRPLGFPRTPTQTTVATSLLTFQLRRVRGELQVDLRAVAVRDASTRQGIGTKSLRTGPYTIEQRFSVFPRN